MMWIPSPIDLWEFFEERDMEYVGAVSIVFVFIGATTSAIFYRRGTVNELLNQAPPWGLAVFSVLMTGVALLSGIRIDLSRLTVDDHSDRDSNDPENEETDGGAGIPGRFSSMLETSSGNDDHLFRALWKYNARLRERYNVNMNEESNMIQLFTSKMEETRYVSERRREVLDELGSTEDVDAREGS